MAQLNERTGKIIDKILYVIFGSIGIFAIYSLIKNIIKGEIPTTVLFTFGTICIGCLSILFYKLYKKHHKTKI
jgi:uncharacterized membrane protein YjjB (DUF3815 family)